MSRLSWFVINAHWMGGAPNPHEHQTCRQTLELIEGSKFRRSYDLYIIILRLRSARTLRQACAELSRSAQCERIYTLLIP